ncbi:MAG: PepSY domain-containing protein [Ideonella sp.]|nr:PepSY domain-containing protein [Ideonella sp.]MCC7459247.1 PepSY domain-containing protein [Nitrospira sp.]
MNVRHPCAPARRLALLGAALCALAAGVAARADERDHDHDHHLARQALQQGKVLPLRTVLDKVEREYPGQALKVEFERDDGRFVYKIRLLQPDGRIARLEVDAVDGRVLGIKRKQRGDRPDADPRR